MVKATNVKGGETMEIITKKPLTEKQLELLFKLFKLEKDLFKN